jgi:hypothetical protein
MFQPPISQMVPKFSISPIWKPPCTLLYYPLRSIISDSKWTVLLTVCTRHAWTSSSPHSTVLTYSLLFIHTENNSYKYLQCI